jgi:hypothetical protein
MAFVLCVRVVWLLRSWNYFNMVKKSQRKKAVRSESKQLIELINKYDGNFSEGQSDLDRLYYFALKSIDEFAMLFTDNRAEFDKRLEQLRLIVEALFPLRSDFV